MAQYVAPEARIREFLTSTAAQAYAGIDHRRIERSMVPDAILRSNAGKLYSLYLTSSVDDYASEHPEVVQRSVERKAKMAA